MLSKRHEFKQEPAAAIMKPWIPILLLVLLFFPGLAVMKGSAASGVVSGQTLKPAVTSTAVTTNLSPALFGQLLTFTASVTSRAGTPSGHITFNYGSKVLGGGTLDRLGKAHLSIPWLPAGLHQIVAVYDGDRSFAPSQSQVLRQLIKRSPTFTTVVSSPEKPATGQVVTFTATVSSPSATPTGVIEFKDGKKTVAAVPLSAFLQATLSTPNLTAGTHMITAVYGGDGNFGPSQSNSLRQTINEARAAPSSSRSPSNPKHRGP